MRKAHLAQLCDGDPNPCRDTGDRESGCSRDPLAQPRQHKAKLNIDGRSVPLHHIVPLAVSRRGGRAPRFEDYRFTLACCNAGRGDATRGPNSETRSRTRARPGDRHGYPLDTGPASTTAGPTARAVPNLGRDHAGRPAEVPRPEPVAELPVVRPGVPKNQRHPHATPAAQSRSPATSSSQRLNTRTDDGR